MKEILKKIPVLGQLIKALELIKLPGANSFSFYDLVEMYLSFVVRFMGAVGSYGRIYIYGMGLSPQADGQGRQQGGQDSADDSTTSNRKVATIHGTVTYDMSIDLICQYSDRSICKIGTQITKIWIYILD